MTEHITKEHISKLIDPRQHDVVQIYTDYWWVVEDEYVLFYKGYSPQCNKKKEIMERVRARIYPHCTLRQIDVAYIEWEN